MWSSTKASSTTTAPTASRSAHSARRFGCSPAMAPTSPATRHGFEFGAQVNGVSFGRYVTSDGVEHFVTQHRSTLGAANAGPKVGPVVINEIMYAPPGFGSNADTLDEYIELRNITGHVGSPLRSAARHQHLAACGGRPVHLPLRRYAGAVVLRARRQLRSCPGPCHARLVPRPLRRERQHPHLRPLDGSSRQCRRAH